MNKFPGACAVLALGLMWSVSAARAQSPTAPLSAGQLIDQVLTGNPSLHGQRAGTAALASVATVAAALADPSISLALAPQTFGAPAGGRAIAQVSQVLPWPGKRALRSTAAREQVNAATALHATLARTLTAEARKLWAQWWYVHETLTLNTSERALLNDQLPVSKAHYASGLGIQTDVLDIQTRLALLAHQRLQIEQRQQALRARINALRGRPAHAALGPPAAAPAPMLLRPTPALREALAANHPALKEKDATARATHARAELARLEQRPDFRVYSGYVGTLDPAAKRWQVGAQISVPIGGRKQRAQAAALLHERDQVQAQRDALRNALIAELETALAQVSYTDQSLALYASSVVPLAEQALAAARSEFAAARGPFADIVAAQIQLVEAQLTIARLRADRLIATADIDALTVTPELDAEIAP